MRRRVITPMSVASGEFSILNSFLMDGIDERGTFPLAGISDVISGTGKIWTISLLIKPASLGLFQYLFSDDSFNNSIRVTSANKIQAIFRGGGAFKSCLSSTSLSINSWYMIDVVYDSSLSLGSRMSIYLNSINDTASDNTLSSIDAPGNEYEIFSRSATEFFNGNFCSLSITDIALTQAQITEKYNNGKPLNPIDLYGVNCKLFLNSDNSGNTAPFSILDSTNNITASFENMEDIDKTNDTPYI